MPSYPRVLAALQRGPLARRDAGGQPGPADQRHPRAAHAEPVRGGARLPDARGAARGGPEARPAAKSLFLEGFLYANVLNDQNKAKEKYQALY